MSAIESVFEQVVSQLPGYESRPQQLEMARLIGRAVAEKRHVLIEAGTGSGKSFGYLIPILESGKKAVVSTGTIALQEQLLQKDLPFLAAAFGREITVALAKGRGNYLCLRKLLEAHRTVPLTDPGRGTIEELVVLSNGGTWSGDRAELPFVVDPGLWLDLLASDPEDCLGPKCPNFMFTPHRIARQKVEDAQIIIANHALYFTDLAMGGSVLPKHDIVVFDEAHHLDRAAAAAFTVHVAQWMAKRLLQRVQRRFTTIPSGLVQQINSAEDAVMDRLFTRGRGQFRLDPDAGLATAAQQFAAQLHHLAGWLQGADAHQMLLLDDDVQAAAQRGEVVRQQMQDVAVGLARRWDHFAALQPEDERANWMQLDPGRQAYELNSAPLDVGEKLQEGLWKQRPAVLTSATLAVDGKFDFLRRELGFVDAPYEAVLGSPFDFPNQAVLYLPARLPEPSDPNFVAGILPEIEGILRMTEGRAFVLCTSYRALREIYQGLLGRVTYPLKTQEDLPRARLIDWFKSTPNAVLVATGTFWEGVDIPGDTLSCVIIDKLPFANPDDPVVKARTDRMRLRGEDWFGGYVLPRAVLALKQGFGRLIRTRTDRGVVAILDRRLTTKQYGEKILRSLPPARRVRRLAASLDDALRSGAAPDPASTRDLLEGGSSRRNLAPPDDLDAVLGPPQW